MTTVNVHEAKTTLSRLLEKLESGELDQVTIARNGTPVAILSPAPRKDASRRIGSARGLFSVPDSIDRDNAAIEALLTGGKR